MSRSSPLLFSSLLSASLTFVVACGSSPSSTAAETPAGSPTTEPSAIGDCAAGTRPVSGDTTCAPVGTTSVPEGFAIGRDSWGFAPVLPKEACTGATIAVLGAAACEPIDDCNAPFPSAAATIVVRADGTPAPSRPSLPVVKTLAEALETATVSTVIAVDEGDYALPPMFEMPVRVVGRCAERTSLRGTDFGVQVDPDLKVSFTSVGFVGSTKAAFRLSLGSVVNLDRVYVHGANNGAVVGNEASLNATRTVFEAPSKVSNPNAALTGINAVYKGFVALTGVEMRGYQLALAAQSKDTVISVKRSVIHDQQTLGAAPEGLAQIGAFLGALVTVDQSHVEAGAGRIAMIGAARLDGQADSTSPGDPPATVRATNSTLVQTGTRREAGSGIDVVEGAFLELDNVSVQHDCFVGLSGSEGSTVTARNSVIQTEPSAGNARIGVSGTKRGNVLIESSAILGSSQFAVMLDGASTADIKGSLIAGNREVGLADFTAFMGAGQAIAIARNGKATIRDSAFVGNQGSSIYLQEATADVQHTVFASTTASSWGPFTAAITSIDATLVVRASAFARNDRALAIRNGRALLTESAVADHHEAVRLEGLVLLESTEAFEEAVEEKLVVARTTFVRNAVRVSSKSLTDE